MSKSIVLIALVSVVIIIVLFKIKNNNKIVKIPADNLDVESLAKILDEELNSPNDVIDSSVNAIINELDVEASEALPSELTPTIPNLELSEKDSIELQSLLSGESSIVSLGLSLLGMAPSPPTGVKELIENPPVDQMGDEIQDKPDTQKHDEDLNKIKEEIVKDETKILNEQIKFLDTQNKYINEEIKVRESKASQEESELKIVHQEELDQVQGDSSSTEIDIKRVKNEHEQELIEHRERVKHEDSELKLKAEQLNELSTERSELSNGVKNNKSLDKKLKNAKHPRKSKKGAVKTSKKTNEDGGISFSLEVPSDLSPDETDQIDIEISKETGEILEQYNEIKTKIVIEQSLRNVSDEEKKIIKSAGNEFKKIKSEYVSKRTEKIRKRKDGIKNKNKAE